MVDQSPSFWKVYWVAEATPGTTPANPAFAFAGITTSGSPTPSPTYNQTRGSGSQHYYTIHRMRRDPEIRLTFHPATVAILTNLINTEQYFSLVLRDSTNSQYVRFLGAKVDRLRVSCDVNEDVVVEMDVKSWTTDNTAPTLGSGSYASDATTSLTAQSLTVSKDASTITDWTRVSFEATFGLVPLYTPSTGVIRSLTRHAIDHTFTVARAMDTATAFDEYADINADTSRTMKILLTNDGAGAQWSAQVNTAKTNGFTADMLRPADIIAKELEYKGLSVTFGTS